MPGQVDSDLQVKLALMDAIIAKRKLQKQDDRLKYGHMYAIDPIKRKLK